MSIFTVQESKKATARWGTVPKITAVIFLVSLVAGHEHYYLADFISNTHWLIGTLSTL